MTQPWILEAPSQAGKLAIVTGANAGLGLETARGLAAAGAEVVIAARNVDKGRAAAAEVGFLTRFEQVDLADLNSIKAFSERLVAAGRPLDLLINNAGLAAAPRRATTRDGFELQFGTNHLGHFALTGRLLPLLRAALNARIVSVSSLAHKKTKLDFENLNSERTYSPVQAYKLSKLAVLMFSIELQRLSDKQGWGLTSLGAHPGLAMTQLTKSRPDQPAFFLNGLVDALSPYIGQSAEAGARVTLHAAMTESPRLGGYYGPDGFGELRGAPKEAFVSAEASNPALGEKLWRVSERLTGVTYH